MESIRKIQASSYTILQPIYTIISLILRSEYSIFLRISSSVGVLSFANLLAFGRPLVIFFHVMTMSFISQNGLTALM